MWNIPPEARVGQNPQEGNSVLFWNGACIMGEDDTGKA